MAAGGENHNAMSGGDRTTAVGPASDLLGDLERARLVAATVVTYSVILADFSLLLYAGDRSVAL